MGGICFDLDMESNQAPKDLFVFISMVYPLAHEYAYSYTGVKRKPLGIRKVAAGWAALPPILH